MDLFKLENIITFMNNIFVELLTILDDKIYIQYDTKTREKGGLLADKT